ncbi:hypothetical protein [Pontibacillus halophilus]|nr:hypothetical protein [Pontibacillus halophilus]
MSKDQVTDPEEVAAKDLPDVPAFEDEFTRGFLTSTQETRPGYYSFLSKTEQFKMDFPRNGVIGEQSYSVEENNSEGIYIGMDNDDSNIRIFLEYYGQGTEPSLETSISTLEGSVGEDLTFKEQKTYPYDLYLASYINDNPKRKGLVAILENNNEVLWVRYTIESLYKGGSEQVFTRETEEFMEWIKSIVFQEG